MLSLRPRSHPGEAIIGKPREGTTKKLYKWAGDKTIPHACTACDWASLQIVPGTMLHCFSLVISLCLLLCNVTAGVAQRWNRSLGLVGSPQDSAQTLAQTFIAEASMACVPQGQQAAQNQTFVAYVAESLLSHQSSFTGNLGL